MITHTLNPIFLKLGFLEIRYYSLFYILGLIIAYFIIYKVAQEKKLKLTKDDVLDYIVYLAFGLLIGARLFYFVFYNFGIIYSDPLELFKVWHGGMSFHGGLIGSLIAGYIFCRQKKINYLDMADITVIPLGLALMFGRIGNFINGELYGRIWDGSLCIDYSQNPYTNYLPKECRFPSQLLESFKNIVIFTIIWNIRKYKFKKGALFSIFLILYGIFRFCIEFVREPDSQLGFFLTYFTMGQILCVLMIITGIILFYYIQKQDIIIKKK